METGIVTYLTYDYFVTGAKFIFYYLFCCFLWKDTDKEKPLTIDEKLAQATTIEELRAVLDGNSDVLETIVGESEQMSAKETEDKLGLDTMTYVMDYSTNAVCDKDGAASTYHVESTLMHCVTSARNCINDSQFSVTTNAAACLVSVVLDSSDSKLDHLTLIERPKRGSVIPLLVGAMLISSGMLVGLKGA
jgi:hypothetical protein